MDYANRAARTLLGATAHPGGTALTARLLDALAVAPGERVLDVACGDGATLRALSRRGAAPLGVDVEPRAVRHARRRAAAVVADAHALPLPDGSCDVVLVECAVSTFDGTQRALAEARRVLRPGGRFGMTDVVLDRARAVPEVVAAIDALTGARTVPDYRRLLAEAGLVPTGEQDCAAEAGALARRVRRRLALVSPRWSAVARACEQAVQDAALGYVLLTARRD